MFNIVIVGYHDRDVTVVRLQSYPIDYQKKGFRQIKKNICWNILLLFLSKLLSVNNIFSMIIKCTTIVGVRLFIT